MEEDRPFVWLGACGPAVAGRVGGLGSVEGCE